MTGNSQRTSSLVMYASMLVVVLWTGHILLRQMYQPGHSLRLLATALLIAGFALLVVAEIRLIRRLDEFQRHVQLLALAVAFGCSLVAAIAIGLLRAEGWFRQADPLPGVMIFLYVIGLGVAWHRYR
ncbi:MAG: hypothetical protein ACE5IP_01785 [Terriglobia bacterium]